MARLISGGIAGIVEMRPLWALVLVAGSLVMSYAILLFVLFLTVGTGGPSEPSDMELLQERLEILTFVLMLPFALLYFAWPVAVSLYLNRSHGAVACVKPRVVAFCYFGFLAAVVMLLGYVVQASQGAAPPPTAPVLVVWFFSVFCFLYMLWTAARALVFVEEGRRVGIDRRIGTFFLFYFLPLSIYFIQRRLQRLVRLRPSG